jgi:hypothetical protein
MQTCLPYFHLTYNQTTATAASTLSSMTILLSIFLGASRRQLLPLDPDGWRYNKWNLLALKAKIKLTLSTSLLQNGSLLVERSFGGQAKPP